MRYFFQPSRYFAASYIFSGRFRAICQGGVPLLVLALFILAGCAGGPVADMSDKAAPATDVGRTQAWRDAEEVVAMGQGRLSAIGAGESMLPVYGEGTVLVLSKIDFDALQPGMQVAFMNDAGHLVVHVLVSLDARTGGWRVRGLNNESDDRTRVTSRNIIGAVYAAFAPSADGK